MAKLTEKQKRFVDFFIKTGNASEAARLAGYSKKTSPWIGQENLHKPTIKAAIDERLKELASKRTASLSEVLEFMTSVMRGEVAEEVVVTEGTGDGCSEARIVPKQVSARDRLEAAKALEKRLGRFIDLEKEEQQLKNEKLRAEVADLKADSDEEGINFEFSRITKETES